MHRLSAVKGNLSRYGLSADSLKLQSIRSALLNFTLVSRSEAEVSASSLNFINFFAALD